MLVLIELLSSVCERLCATNAVRPLRPSKVLEDHPLMDGGETFHLLKGKPATKPWAKAL